MTYLIETIKRDIYASAEALTERGRPAHPQEQLGGQPYVVVTGDGLHYAFEPHEARKLAKGEAAKPSGDLSAAVVYYARTGRQLGDVAGKAILSPEQIAALDALLRWG
jgi:precorrin-6B methylase 1